MKPVCLITGAGGLLGNALCDNLSEHYQVVGTYNKTIPKHSSQLVKSITPNGTNEIFCIQGDLTNKEDIRRIVDVTKAKFGQIDVVINNAVDYTIQGKLIELYQDTDYVVSKLYMNSVVPFQLVSYIFQTCWKDSTEENLTWNRNVLNISSIAGVKLFTTSEAYYSASKSAMNMLTQHLASELENYKVRANAICPAGFDFTGALYIAEKVEEILKCKNSGEIIANIY